jgi:hypothetical protein
MVWCLAAFVLISSYNSLLVSYVISPNAEPLIHDMKDLSNASKIHLVVDAGNGFDIAFSVSFTYHVPLSKVERINVNSVNLF